MCNEGNPTVAIFEDGNPVKLPENADEVFIYEDVSKRKRGNNLFWGGYFDENGEFIGENVLGEIWMKIMDEI